MKLLHITSAYPEYFREIYQRNNQLAGACYRKQKDFIDYDAFGWGDFWYHALRPRGVDIQEIWYNAAPLQYAWWREYRSETTLPEDIEEIAAEQAADFQPEVLWFNESSPSLLQKIREKCPKLKVVVGWAGSALPPLELYDSMDLVFSCAQESVDRLNSSGKRAALMHHGFEPRILDRVPKTSEKEFAVTFIGQIIRGSEFHNERSKLLEDLARNIDLSIFSSIAGLGQKHEIRTKLQQVKYGLDKTLFAAGLTNKMKRKSLPVSQRNPQLEPYLHPAKYGLEMYETIRKSKVVLNIHADSSPKFASNMRLFETTGMGSCLFTDWRENLPELFRPDFEIVTYKNREECIEKAKWLLEHPREAEAIAKAGQERTLREHTFSHRAEGFLAKVKALL